jgi:hypothetical protein
MPADAKTTRVLEFLEHRASEHEAMATRYRALIRVLREQGAEDTPHGRDVPSSIR